nr:ANTAR domain-containing protein [Lachnospiraceae bacterium]
MSSAMRVYSVLLVSAAEKFNTSLMPLFAGGRFEPVTVVDSVAKARRKLVDRSFDFVIVNSPMPDEFGRSLVVDLASNPGIVPLLLVKNEMYEELFFKLYPHGILVGAKPISVNAMRQFLDSMCTFRERLRGVEKKTVTLEDKMEEIRLVNRAKWSLIKACGMTEEDAHRYVQKQAMDLCLSKREVAENILRTYG